MPAQQVQDLCAQTWSNEALIGWEHAAQEALSVAAQVWGCREQEAVKCESTNLLSTLVAALFVRSRTEEDWAGMTRERKAAQQPHALDLARRTQIRLFAWFEGPRNVAKLDAD
ncbi:hypothetical protein H2199_001911 [Coniosporium tulheliwenetii]|uniref:Uncharacterized protein n=1 Tax=Coniosporium tulheliwenetii TaxID=3383036 RepID=A0ACC2ZKW9_9PEZI|nr:hypothetical protein H2199_001911 [Cladosporium sp. JES 115]